MSEKKSIEKKAEKILEIVPEEILEAPVEEILKEVQYVMDLTTDLFKKELSPSKENLCKPLVREPLNNLAISLPSRL